MAEEIVVKEPLTLDMIEAGEALTRQLDSDGWPVTAAFWLFDAEASDWRLMFASPKAADGPQAAYSAVAKALAALQQSLQSLGHITVVEPDHPIVRALASIVPAGRSVEGRRLSRHAFQGRYIDDAYLYRVTPSAA